MDESNQQNTNPQQPTNQPELVHRRVIQPSETFVQEMQAPLPIQTSVVARDFKPPTEQSNSERQPIFNQPIPPVPTVPTPFGVSASQMGLSQQQTKIIGWRTYLKKSLVPLVVLVLIVGGYLFYKSYTGFATKTVSNFGYNYSYKFYRNAALIHVNDGSTAYKQNDSIVAGVEPRDAGLNAFCGEIGPGWTEVFTVRVYGTTRPVCAINNKGFTMEFSALNHNHLFTVVYNGTQNSSVYPTLQTIFSSVKVSQ